MGFVFKFPKDVHKNTGILVFVDRFSKMVHLIAVPESITAQGRARVFIDTNLRLHGLPHELVSDRDPRFTAEFWQFVFRLLGTRLKMSTSDHPETDGQTERVKVFEETLRGYAHSFMSWIELLPMAKVRHQQLGARVDYAYTVIREWPTPSTFTRLLRVFL
uniref:Integrase catalytic domain-containing protein n=1 Tax=Peronospora matthiolae TaxID=2874970 RepID=A0AAV1T4K4_9STRA